MLLYIVSNWELHDMNWPVINMLWYDAECIYWQYIYRIIVLYKIKQSFFKKIDENSILLRCPGGTYFRVFQLRCLEVGSSPCNALQLLVRGLFPGGLSSLVFLSFFKRFYLLIFRESRRDRERGRKTSMCGCFSHTPNWGPGLQLRHVPWLGIKPATLWSAGQHSIHWATPARAVPWYI